MIFTKSAKNLKAVTLFITLISLFTLFSACGSSEANSAQNPQQQSELTSKNPPADDVQTAAPKPHELQSEIIGKENTLTTSDIGKIDFENFTFPLPRGWQDSDGSKVELKNGVRRMSENKIGISHVTTKYGDATGDGEDEAFVILKIETAGSAIPQVVYVYSLKNNEPDLIWHFRTGDRADGGLKKIYTEEGNIVVELYGQDRYILGEVETNQITGDESQICCPTHYTRSKYKWNGSNFRMDGKRETFSMTEEDTPPEENKNEAVLRKNKNKS